MQQFKRIDATGTEARVSQHADGWRIDIHIREADHTPAMIWGYLQPTLEMAKSLADGQLLKHGHVCNDLCKDWV